MMMYALYSAHAGARVPTSPYCEGVSDDKSALETYKMDLEEMDQELNRQYMVYWIDRLPSVN